VNQEFDIREAIGDDLSFIYHSWIKSYKDGSALGRSCRNPIFRDNYRFIIDDILIKSNVLVACKNDNPDVVFGFIVYNNSTLHYVFTKQAFRRFGIAKALFNEASKDFKDTTHKTIISTKINHDLSYNPFLLYAAINKEK